MNSNSKVRKIAFVGDHLPRKCGIAIRLVRTRD
jgi:hypothetical protein